MRINSRRGGLRRFGAGNGPQNPAKMNLAVGFASKAPIHISFHAILTCQVYSGTSIAARGTSDRSFGNSISHCIEQDIVMSGGSERSHASMKVQGPSQTLGGRDVSGGSEFRFQPGAFLDVNFGDRFERDCFGRD
jgi:hypothetical protein